MPLSDDQSGRFRVIPAPVASPGSCGICGYGGGGRQYVDLGLDFEFFGTLIFCVPCAQALGAVVGCLPLETSEALEKRVEAAEFESAHLRGVALQMEQLRELFATHSLYSPGDGNSSEPVVGLPSEGESSTDAGTVSGSVEEGTTDSGGAEQLSFESVEREEPESPGIDSVVVVEGPNGVSDSRSNAPVLSI